MRTSAAKLRKHNWITNNVKRGSQKLAVTTKAIPVAFDDAMLSVQEYNHKINGPDILLKDKSLRPQKISMNTQLPSLKINRDRIDKHIERGIEDWSQDIDFGADVRNAPLQLRRLRQMNPPPSTKKQSMSGSEDWDDDFDSSIAGKLPQSPRLTNSRSPTRARHHKIMNDESSQRKTHRVSQQTRYTEMMGNLPTPRTSRRLSSNSTYCEPDRISSHDSGKGAASRRVLAPQKLQRGSSDPYTENGRRSALALQSFAETSENYDDILTDQLSLNSNHKTHNSQLSNKSWLHDDDIGEDPFADIEEFAQENLSMNVAREQKARISQLVEQLLREFQSRNCSGAELNKCVREIIALLSDHPDLKSVIIAAHGLLPLLETLEQEASDELVLLVLQLLNLVAADDLEILENMCVRLS